MTMNTKEQRGAIQTIFSSETQESTEEEEGSFDEDGAFWNDDKMGNEIPTGSEEAGKPCAVGLILDSSTANPVRATDELADAELGLARQMICIQKDEEKKNLEKHSQQTLIVHRGITLVLFLAFLVAMVVGAHSLHDTHVA